MAEDDARNDAGDDIVWTYRDSEWTRTTDLVGYEVEASDGGIGKVDEATDEATGSWLVVDTGFWIFGKKRLVPAGAVVGIEHEQRLVVLGLTKDEVKDAPDYESDDWGEARRQDEARVRHAAYYDRFVGR